MRKSEEAIERVLAGLRNCEPPDGLERRILEAAQGAAESRLSARDWRAWVAFRPPILARPDATASIVFGAALASMVLVAVIVPAIYRHGPGIGHASATSANEGRLAQPRPNPPEEIASPDTARRGRRPFGAMKTVGAARLRSARFVREADSIALSEMRAPSLPAPPMPLTEQEKLLLRVAHRGDLAESAMLNPVVEAKQEKEEAAEFEAFFAPPPRPEIEQPSDRELQPPTKGDKE